MSRTDSVAGEVLPRWWPRWAPDLGALVFLPLAGVILVASVALVLVGMRTDHRFESDCAQRGGSVSIKATGSRGGGLMECGVNGVVVATR